MVNPSGARHNLFFFGTPLPWWLRDDLCCDPITQSTPIVLNSNGPPVTPRSCLEIRQLVVCRLDKDEHPPSCFRMRLFGTTLAVGCRLGTTTLPMYKSRSDLATAHPPQASSFRSKLSWAATFSWSVWRRVLLTPLRAHQESPQG